MYRKIRIISALLFLALLLLWLPAFAEDAVYHTVTFVVDGEERFAQMVKDGEIPVMPEAPVLEGAEFVGWFDGKTAQLTGETRISGDAVFTAEFRDIGKRVVVIEYTDGSGQAVAPPVIREYAGDEKEAEEIASPHVDRMYPGQAAVSVDSGALIQELTTISVEYFDLEGPYTIRAYLETLTDDEFEYDGALDSMSDAFDPADAPDGFTLLRVTVAEAAEDGTVAARAYYGRNENMLAFDAMEGTPVLPVAGKYGAEMILPTTSRRGYRLEGWYLDAECEVAAGSPGGVLLMPVTSETTLFAKWTSRTVPYTVVYWLSKPEVLGTPDPDQPEQYAYYARRTLSAFAGEEIAENEAEKIEIDGVAADFAYSTPGVALGDGTAVIHAYYNRTGVQSGGDAEKPSYALSFNTLGTPDNADVPKAVAVSAGQPLAGLSPENWDDSVTMTVGGITHTFDGWRESADGYGAVDFDAASMPDGDYELFARWTRPLLSVRISLNDGGDQQGQAIVVPAGEVIEGLLPKMVEKAGYVFSGWYLDEACAQKFDAALPVFADTMLFAGFEKLPVSYEVLYLKENGEYAAQPKRVMHRAEGETVLEHAPVVSGMRPDAARRELTLGASDEENVITFNYTEAKTAAYTVEYGYYEESEQWVELAEPERVETESGRAVVWAKDFSGHYPMDKFKTLYLVAEESENAIRFEYAAYKSVDYTVRHAYFDGEKYVEDSSMTKWGPALIGETVMDFERTTDKHVFNNAQPEKYVTVTEADAANQEPIELTYEYGYGRGTYTVEYYYRNADGTDPAEPDGSETRDELFDSVVSVTEEDKQPRKAGYVLDGGRDADFSGAVPVYDDLTLKVYFVPDFDITTSIRYSVQHIGVDGEGNQITEPFAVFPNVVEYWSGYEPPVLTRETLRDDAVYPGFVFLEDDQNVNGAVEDGAVYSVRYAANYEDTAVISFMVNHVAQSEDGEEMMFAAFPVDQEYWVGGPLPALSEEMLRNDAVYPGYQIVENEARLSSPVANGEVYTVKYAPNYDDLRTIRYTVRHVGIAGEDNDIRNVLAESPGEVTIWSGGEAPALTEEMLGNGEEYPGYTFGGYDERVGSPIADGGVYEALYAANYEDNETVSFKVTHIARDDEGKDASEFAAFEESLTYWRGDKVPSLTGALLKSDLRYPGYKLAEMDEKLGEIMEDGQAFEVWYAPDYEDLEPLRVTIVHVVADAEGEPTAEILKSFTLNEDYWRGGEAPVLTASMLDKPERYPGYVCLGDDERVGEAMVNGEMYIVRYAVNPSDTTPVSYTVVHAALDDDGKPSDKPLDSFEESVDVWNGGPPPDLTEALLYSESTYPGYVLAANDKRLGEPISGGAVYEVKYARNYDDAVTVAYRVEHVAGDVELSANDKSLSYWRGGEPVVLDAEILMSDKLYPGYVHDSDDERVGKPVEDGAVYQVSYLPNYEDETTIAYTVRHVGVDGDGNPIGGPLYEFTDEVKYWSGGATPVLAEEMLKADRTYPGYVRLSLDTGIGDTLAEGAIYTVSYRANYGDTAPFTYAVEHAASGDEAKTLSRFEETIDVWRGGAAPALTAEMLKKPEEYPGYVFAADDERVGEPIEDGGTYVVRYEKNPEDTVTLSYTVEHAIVNSKGNPSGEFLGKFEESAIVWRGGNAPALTAEMLKKPAEYPGYTMLKEDERIGDALSDGATYLVKYGKNPDDLAEVAFTVAHIAVDENGNPVDVALLNAPSTQKYWRGGSAPNLTLEMLKKPANGYPGYRFYENDGRVGETLAEGETYVVKYVANYDDIQSIHYKITHIVVDAEGNPAGKQLAAFTENVQYWRGGSAPALTPEMLKKPDEYPGYRLVSEDSRIGKAIENGEVFEVRYAVDEEDVAPIRYTVSHVILKPDGTPTGETLLNVQKEIAYWRGGPAPELTLEMLMRPERYPGYIFIASDRRVGRTLEDGETYVVKYAINEDDMQTLTYEVSHVTQGGEELGHFKDNVRYWRGGSAPALTEQILRNDAQYPGYRRIRDDERLSEPLSQGETYVVKYGELEKVTIRYVARPGGSVSVNDEWLNPQIGTARGTVASPSDEYAFENWTDFAGNVVSTDAAFTPVKGQNAAWPDGTTFYANFVSDWPEVVSLRGTITWVGVPEEVTCPTVVVELYQNSGSEPYRTLSVAAGESGFSFGNLPRRDENGTEHFYTVREVTPDDFTATQEGYDIVNTYIPGLTGVSVRVLAELSGDAEIAVKLLQDGEPYVSQGGEPDLLKLRKGIMSGRFENLPKYAPDGHEYEYRPVADGEWEIGGTMKTGFTIELPTAG